ncbi:MAG: hypothetical protein IPJ07_03845 [Acidobacteria bacterium]|nr:hypothetical protein [Acidobacteriota bacterium]
MKKLFAVLSLAGFMLLALLPAMAQNNRTGVSIWRSETGIAADAGGDNPQIHSQGERASRDMEGIFVSAGIEASGAGPGQYRFGRVLSGLGLRLQRCGYATGANHQGSAVDA